MSGQSQSRETSAAGRPDGETVTESLVRRLAGAVSHADRARAALHVLDWTGCAVAGAASPAGEAMARTISGDDALATALRLGAYGNVLEMDDVDKRALLHPGPVVIPAAVAAATSAGADSGMFLDGVVRGYEAVIRIGRAVGPAHYRYWHNTGTCGPFGAAAAASSIFDLDAEHQVQALGLAGTQASGFWQTRHEPASHAKQLHTSRAAHAGLLGAMLAKESFVGPKTILEGEQGFFAATCGDADPYATLAYADDASWAIHDVSFKPWPACRHAHAAIDAALALKAQGLTADDMSAMTVKTYRDAIVFCDKPAPADTLSAKFSLQHAAAVALLRGAPALSDFEGDALGAAEIAALRKKIAVAEDETFTARYPARFGAAIEATTHEGDTHEIEIGDALGDPENPVSEAALLGKARMLMIAGGAADAEADALIEAALHLSEGGGFARYAGLLHEALA